MEEKNDKMEHLRATLLKDIELQEHIREVLKKTARRFSIILVTVSVLLLVLLVGIIYMMNRPVSQAEKVMQNTRDLGELFVKRSEIVLQQINLLREERKDAAVARKDFAYGNARLDSIIKAQDSIIKNRDSILDIKLDLQYKRLIKKK